MKITLNDVGNLVDATTAKNTINSNSAAIETAFENTLSRDGTAPNQMESSIDMNSNQIINLPDPATPNSPLRLQDLSDFIGGGTVTNIPAGGTTGQVFAKNSNADYDVAWKNSVTSVGLSLPSDFTVTNSPVTTTGTLTATLTNTPTGTGGFVRQTSPTLITPLLGTPTSGVATNLTGTAAGLTAGHVTTNANLTGPITSTGNATSIASQTGTGTKFVVDTSPTLVTPIIGVAAGTSLSLSGLTASNAVATDGSKNLVSVANTGTGSNVLATSPALTTPTGIVKNDVGLGNVDNTSDVTKWAAAKTLTNTIYDTAGAGNSFLINGQGATGNTGTGVVVRQNNPTFTSPVLGAATATTINGAALDNLAWTVTTPTVTASTGTFTTVACSLRTKIIGKTAIFTATITITTAGTATNNIQFTLPFTPTTAHAGGGKEINVTGVQCNWQTSGTTCIIARYDNSTIIGDGRTIIITGTVETT